ncbi:CHAT domain-containing protein [uncultured Microscilla sp.]|uniref:CHAT domain-containing protein n=1 Tax=uncultured Microscilla sp. TaxID=432653 RepID=UPI002635C086|nr:CHAT domain-containing tetratricopeptide repeat protein [uncultured Microscilla sp.]
MHNLLHFCRFTFILSILSWGLLNSHQAQSQIKIGKLVNKDKLKNNLARKLRTNWEKRLKKLKEDFNKESFSYAIAFTDNAGFYEDKQRFARYQRLSNNMVKLRDNLKQMSLKDLKRLAKDENKTGLEKAREMRTNSKEMIRANGQKPEALTEIGQMAFSSNKFKIAEDAFTKAKKIYDKRGKTNDERYNKLLSNISLLYHTTGRFNEADEYTTRMVELNAKQYGKTHSAYASALNNRAMLLKDLGKYTEAERLIDQAMGIVSKNEGKNSTPYAIMTNNKAILYQTIGRYTQAEKLLKEAITTSGKSMREGATLYQRFLINQALLFQDMKRYEEAEAIYKKAIKRKQRQWKKNHPDYAYMLNNLAALYVEMGKDSEIEQLLKQAQKIYEKKFGKKHPGYAATISNLGNFYRAQEKYDQAKPLLREALVVRETLLSNQHPAYAESQEDLAILHWRMGNVSQAAILYREVLKRSATFINKYFPAMSEAEKEKYWNKLRPTYLRFYAFAAENHPKDNRLLTDMFNYHLSTKAILLSNANKIRKRILGSSNQKLIDDYKYWLDVKEILAKLYTYSQADLEAQDINLDSLEKAVNKMERDLSNRSKDFSGGVGDKTIGFSEVAKALANNEAVVEMVQFYQFKNNFTNIVYYAALVVTPQSTSPKIVVLKNGDHLETRYLKYYRNTIKNKLQDRYSYKKYWSEIEPLLTKAKTVYISPDGVYNQINLNTLQKPNGKYLIEEQSFIVLTNSKDLIGLKKRKPLSTNRQAVLVGFPDYGSAGKIPALPGTKKEVITIEGLLKSSGYSTQKLMAKKASEESVKTISDKQPKILHIATHGFFLKDKDLSGNKLFGVEIEKAKENPLLRSGLMLADSEKAMDNSLKNKENQTNNNGILTAYEAMNMSLDKTELVVLSACETGLGDVKAGEGVYGLQRAFQVAGAQALIMSLWKVSDAATQQLMTLFYKNWLQLGDKAKAFKKAQLQLKATFKEPFYWGAFVLIGS